MREPLDLGRVDLAVRLELHFGRPDVQRFQRPSPKVLRHHNAAAGEVLVAGRPGLSVPQLLVHDLDGGNLGDSLEAERAVAEVGD